MEKKSRLRGPNFTPSEKLLLCNIIAKQKDIIENKKTDGINLAQKNKAWEKVMEEFNASTSGFARNIGSLQHNYKNLKKKAKQQTSDAKMDIPIDREYFVQNIEEYGTSDGWEKVATSVGISKDQCQDIFTTMTKEAQVNDNISKKNIMCTGGGPPSSVDNENNILNKVKALMGPAIDGLYTIYDGDSNIMSTADSSKKQPIEAQNLNIEEIPSQDPSTQTNKEEFLFTNNRAHLKRKPHHLLTRKTKLASETPKKQTVCDKFQSLATEKMELVALQKELVQTQLLEENEKLKHNRLLRAMEMEEAKKKYEHNDLIRKIELEQLNKIQ